MDLRYQCLLTEEKKKIAQEHLLATWRRIHVMRNDEDIAPVADDQTPTSLDPLEALLRSRDKGSCRSMTVPSKLNFLQVSGLGLSKFV